jgi:hypothetical protein
MVNKIMDDDDFNEKNKNLRTIQIGRQLEWPRFLKKRQKSL